jgi:CRISPR-associated endonuclease Cas2
MSLVMEILEHLWNTTTYYRGMRINLFGFPKPWRYKNRSVQTTLSRLHKKGFVKNVSGKWSTTKSGMKYFKQRNLILTQFNSKFKKDSPKNLLLMYDIPESKKSEREWFRYHLKKFSYIMIQKSVWVGPSPLPKEFTDYVKEIKLSDSIKTFKLAKSYQIKNKKVFDK